MDVRPPGGRTRRIGPWVAFALACGAASAADAGEPQRVALATTDWRPYIGQDLPGNGYVYQLVSTAFARAGYAADIQFYPWARALALAREGKVTGLLPEYYDESREADFAYSQPFPGGPVGFYARRDRHLTLPKTLSRQPAEALRTLRHLRFGVVRGYLNAPVFDQADLTREEAKDDLTNLRKLYHGRVDAIVIDRYVADYLLRTALPKYRDALEFLEPPLAQQPLYVAFSLKAPAHEAVRQAFNRGLAEVISASELARIMRRTGLPPDGLLATPPR